MTSNNNDIYDKLYADEEPFDREELVDIISNFLKIEPDTGEILFHDSFHDLTENQKVVLGLLYRRVAKDMDELDESLEVSPPWIDETFGVDEMEAVDCCMDLSFISEEDERYFISKINIDTAIDWFRD